MTVAVDRDALDTVSPQDKSLHFHDPEAEGRPIDVCGRELATVATRQRMVLARQIDDQALVDVAAAPSRDVLRR